MANVKLAASLAALLGFAVTGASQAGSIGSADGLRASEVQPDRYAVVASSDLKGSDASCKGKDGACKSKESSCKGKDGACKSKDTKVCEVGGAKMYANKDIIDNASNSPIHTTLVAAVKAAGLVDTLKGAGPFTVFAPTNDAFKALPAGTVDNLLKPESKETLVKILTYHVVPGHLDAKALKEQIKSGGGRTTLKTVQGEELTAKMKGSKIILVDSKGGEAKVTQGDVEQSNGVIHVVDKVLMP